MFGKLVNSIKKVANNLLGTKKSGGGGGGGGWGDPAPVYNPPKTINTAGQLLNVKKPQSTSIVPYKDSAAKAAAEQRAREQQMLVERENRRRQVQSSLDRWLDSSRRMTDQNNKKAQDQKNKGKNQESPEYGKVYDQAFEQAMKDYDSKKQPGNQGFFQKVWDKVSMGQDRRDIEARSYAARKAQAVATQWVKAYELKLNAFLAQQAKNKADIESKKFASQQEFDKAVNNYTAWESSGIRNLENDRAMITASMDAYGVGSEAGLTSKAARTVGFANKFLVQGLPGKTLGKVFQYTLGSGGKDIPSIATTPSRVVNWLGNLNNKDRTIYQSGGTSINRSNSSLNAWQATQNQRNFNIKPVTDQSYDKNTAWKELSTGKSQTGALQDRWYSNIFKAAKTDTEKEDIAKKYWDSRNRSFRNMNSLQEFAADPLMLLGFGKGVAKATKAGEALSEAGRANKMTSWLFRAAEKAGGAKDAALAKAAENKVIKWLGSEAQTPEQRLADAIEQAKVKQGAAQKDIFPQLREINKNLARDNKLDLTVFDDFSKLTDSEAAVLQRMTNGKLAARDRFILAGRNSAPIREKLEGIATKWQDFSEKMREADRVYTTRFGKGKKTYSPHTAWVNGDLKKYNFRLKSKNPTQTVADFRQGAIDRYFKSELDRVNAGNVTANRKSLLAQRQALQDEYEGVVGGARTDVEEAFNKTKSVSNKARRLAGLPTRVWKKAVLGLRPAWYVNNELYNTQAAVLAGGRGALGEKFKMLSPRYWRKAMDELPEGISSDIANELGKGKLSKFATRQENWSRVAAFRSAKKQGLTDEQALKRVNKYLLSYKTKNWERPIKAVVPFWQFQKGVAKAAATMPFDRPAAAMAYNRLDRYQQTSFDKEFEKIVPELTRLGYTEQEIQDIKAENAKYFKGRLKLGSKWITTPFNAFSDKAMSSMSINPYLAAAGETADSVDQYGNPVGGRKASFIQRLIGKFPQADLVNQKLSRPSKQGWIGKKGSSGYGLTKEKQGFDTTKPNYSRELDPDNKLRQNAWAFAGVPRSMEFDTGKLLESKTLQKATAEYFSHDWDSMEYPDQQAKQQEIFDKYGLTADEFYKGILSKYDTENTKAIKGKKEAAAKANKSLFDEYSKQPYGTKNAWATEKLRQLVSQGYFNDNPFLKSFKWITPTTVAKAGQSSQKKADWQYAMRTGDWSKWRAKYGSKSSPHQYAGKYFKTAASRERYIEGEFWRRWAEAGKEERRELLKANPQYNRRADWTDAQWDQWKKDRKATAAGFGNMSAFIEAAKADSSKTASKFTVKSTKKPKNVKFRLQS